MLMKCQLWILFFPNSSRQKLELYTNRVITSLKSALTQGKLDKIEALIKFNFMLSNVFFLGMKIIEARPYFPNICGTSDQEFIRTCAPDLVLGMVRLMIKRVLEGVQKVLRIWMEIFFLYRFSGVYGDVKKTFCSAEV